MLHLALVDPIVTGRSGDRGCRRPAAGVEREIDAISHVLVARDLRANAFFRRQLPPFVEFTGVLVTTSTISNGSLGRRGQT